MESDERVEPGALRARLLANQAIARYNYDVFVPQKFEPWMNFDHSPPLGERAPDFPLWDLDEQPVQLSDIWSQSLYTIVEFGSFT